MNFNDLANKDSVIRTSKALQEKGYEAFVVKNGAEALEKIKEIIPENSSVMNGSSDTLIQIGYSEYLKSGNHKWIDLYAKVAAETDRVKRGRLRREAELSDYYLGSVNALLENGDFLVASNTGSQLPHIAFTSPNLIFVVSTKKIVANFDDAMERIEKYVYPLVDKSLMEKVNLHSALNKVLIFKGESHFLGRKIRFILVEENLGY